MMVLSDDLIEEADRVAAVVAEARAKAKKAGADRAAAAAAAAAVAAPAAPVYDIGDVDVDMCLSFNQADALCVEAEADSVFDDIDLDGDGVITKDELRSHIAGAEMLSPESVDRIFEIVDVAPADGSISRAELRAAFSRYESITMRLALGLASGRQLQPSPSRRALADVKRRRVPTRHFIWASMPGPMTVARSNPAFTGGLRHHRCEPRWADLKQRAARAPREPGGLRLADDGRRCVHRFGY